MIKILHGNESAKVFLLSFVTGDRDLPVRVRQDSRIHIICYLTVSNDQPGGTKKKKKIQSSPSVCMLLQYN